MTINATAFKARCLGLMNGQRLKTSIATSKVNQVVRVDPSRYCGSDVVGERPCIEGRGTQSVTRCGGGENPARGICDHRMGVCLSEKLGKTGQSIGGDGKRWFYEAVHHVGLTILPIDDHIAIESRRLPEPFHKDPGDRFVVATARVYDISVITSDIHILDFAALGHVRAIAC